ncbi:MAG TPA: MoxR family ATPase [Actinomycetota bacterium]|nr:MoxR family ATPase [Actinomycetota bacterium]
MSSQSWRPPGRATGARPEASFEETPSTVEEGARILEAARFEIKKVIAGQDRMLEKVVTALIARGHVLLEGVPGLAKTLTVRTIAQVFGGIFKRVQFTPDLVPSDLIGTRVLEPGNASFRVELGPVFANFLLADEINRAPAKVQSALLEVMQERQVTIGGTSFPVPDPFLTLATQNPIESEGTYPLPEAQLDRFMLKVLVDYPEYHDELAVVDRAMEPPLTPNRILGPETLRAIQELTRTVYVDWRLRDYSVKLASATRRPRDFGIEDVEPYIQYGASPRAPINLILAARALAILRGRDYVLPAEIESLASDVLRHRIVPSYRALAEGISADDILGRVQQKLPVPQIDTVTWNRPSWAMLSRGMAVRPEVPSVPAPPGED